MSTLYIYKTRNSHGAHCFSCYVSAVLKFINASSCFFIYISKTYLAYHKRCLAFDTASFKRICREVWDLSIPTNAFHNFQIPVHNVCMFFVLSVLWFLIINGMVHGSLTEVPIKNIQNISRGNEQRLPASYKY